MDERTRAEKLAFTLRYLVKEGCIPGLLPEDVEAAAALLVEQEKELDLAREALAAKRHIVTAEAEREHYRLKLKGTFVISDPRIYQGEIVVDDRTVFAAGGRDWELHIARQLTRIATAEWTHDLEEQAFTAVRKAIAMETRRAETEDTGSVAKP